MRVNIKYATKDKVTPTQMCNPYPGLELSVTGDITTVANWIDEHLEIIDAVLSDMEYTQGSRVECIKRDLAAGGIQLFGDVAFEVTHLQEYDI